MVAEWLGHWHDGTLGTVHNNSDQSNYILKCKIYSKIQTAFWNRN